MSNDIIPKACMSDGNAPVHENAGQLGLGSSWPESTQPGPIYSLLFSIRVASTIVADF